jgi:hypothetical protein
LIVIGCGGGGGGGTSTSSSATNASATGTATDLRLAAPVGGGIYVDPTNVEVGESLNFNVYGLDSNRNMVEVTATNWGTNAPASVATLDANGVVTGVSASPTTYTVSASAQNGTVSGSLRVRPAQAKVSGVVMTGAGVAGDPVVTLPGAIVVFYTEDGSTEVGRAVTTSNGSFRASVPTTARRVTVQISDSSAYHKTFSIGANGYVGDLNTCYAPVPALTNGTTTPLPDEIRLYRKVLGPPPPPSGCLD